MIHFETPGGGTVPGLFGDCSLPKRGSEGSDFGPLHDPSTSRSEDSYELPTSSDLKLNRCQRGLKLLKPWYDDGRYLTLAQFIRYQSECGLLDVGSRRGDTLRTKQAAFRDEYRI